MANHPSRASSRRGLLMTAALAGSSLFEINNANAATDSDRCAIRSGRVKHIGFVSRKSGMTIEDFVDYWTGKHAAIASRMPGILRYSINIIDKSRFPNFEYDGFSEVWFASEEARLAAFASPEGKLVVADVPNFVGIRTALVSVEHQFI